MKYRETVWSKVYPGNRHTSTCFRTAVRKAETPLELSPAQRRRTVWRLDGGSGSDAHFQWLCDRGYHFLAKGASHRRAAALARQVRRWDAYAPHIWLGLVASPVDYGRPVHVWVKRRLKNDHYVHSYYVSTLHYPSKGHYMVAYDNRGGAEVEQFRNDKSGLGLSARRKYSFTGQQGYILLGDLAHNLLSDFYWRALAESPFRTYGIKRIVRDLLAIPGTLFFAHGHLTHVQLSLTQLSRDLVPCLLKYCSGGLSVIEYPSICVNE